MTECDIITDIQNKSVSTMIAFLNRIKYLYALHRARLSVEQVGYAHGSSIYNL